MAANADTGQTARMNSISHALRSLPPLIRLALLGLAMQAIYVIFIAGYPLISNTASRRSPADLEILSTDARWFVVIYAAGILALYLLFWEALRLAKALARQGDGDAVKILVLAFGLVFGLTLIWLYPVSAIDLFGYVVRGRVWAVYGQSPLVTPPSAFPGDPYLAYAGEFGGDASAYGPLWELLVQIPLRLGATDMLSGAFAVKLIVLGAYLVCLLLIGWLARPGEHGFNPLLALTFVAWNPLILMQGIGNGHNDMALLAAVTLALILWQHDEWWGAGLALALATLFKLPGLFLIPIYGVALLRRESTWRGRLWKGAVTAVTMIGVMVFVYAASGPFPQVLGALGEVAFERRGYGLSDAVRMVLRELVPRSFGSSLPRYMASNLFLIYYGWLLLRVWQNRLTLAAAGFRAIFAEIVLGPVFHYWYPLWLVPLAAFNLTSRSFCRTFLFGLTAELAVVGYVILWRWWLRDVEWARNGLLAPYWNYWAVMTLLNVPWVFGLPVLAPILMERNNRPAFDRELWI